MNLEFVTINGVKLTYMSFAPFIMNTDRSTIITLAILAASAFPTIEIEFEIVVPL